MTPKPERLPDGRLVEYVHATWAEHHDDDPPNGLPVDITVAVDGELVSMRVFLTDKQMLAALSTTPEEPE